MNEKYIFVSILGTQLMGTFQPLMSFVREFGPVKSFFILTEWMQKELEPRKDEMTEFVAKHDLGEAEIIPGSARPGADDYIPDLLCLIAEDAQAEGARLVFNIVGGMNYLLSAAVYALAPFQPLYIQTSRTRAILHDAAEDVYKQLKLPQPLPIRELLALQAVPYRESGKHGDVNKSMPLVNYLKEQAIPLPGNALANAEIGGIVFDHVWNPGNNRLHFLKDWRVYIDDPREKLARERDLADWSKNRKRCGDVHDKNVTVVVQDDKSAQRLCDGSGGKIGVINLGIRSGSITGADEVRGALAYKVPNVKVGECKRPESANLDPMPDNTLVVALGDNLITTFLAIASHKPAHLIICHDRTNPVIVAAAQRLLDNAPQLGLKSARAIQLAIEGIYPDLILPKAETPESRIIVNITPGSKGQTAGLTHWAMKNGHEVWSLDNGERVCSPLTPGLAKAKIPLDIWDPALLIRLLGREIQNAGIRQDRLTDVEELDAMLAFMRACDEAGLDINTAFSKGKLQFGDNLLERKGDELWKLTVNGNTCDFHKQKKGVWYERLCARALMNAGASRLRMNLKLAWNEEIERQIYQDRKPVDRPHQWETDVLACFEGDLVLLSAKSYPLQETVTPEYHDKNGKPLPTLKEAAEEVGNTGAYLGPFTLTLASDLGSSKRVQGKKTVVLGWRELCRPEVLAEEIRSLRGGRRTTK